MDMTKFTAIIKPTWKMGTERNETIIYVLAETELNIKATEAEWSKTATDMNMHWRRICIPRCIPPYNLQWCTKVVEIKPSLWRIQCYKVFLSGEPGVGQNTALHASPADQNSSVVVSAFTVHSTSFSPLLFRYSEWGVSHEQEIRLLFLI